MAVLNVNGKEEQHVGFDADASLSDEAESTSDGTSVDREDSSDDDSMSSDDDTSSWSEEFTDDVDHCFPRSTSSGTAAAGQLAGRIHVAILLLVKVFEVGTSATASHFGGMRSMATSISASADP